MKTKLLIYLCILALVTFLVGHTYACPCDEPTPLFTVYPSHYDAATDTYYVCVGDVITFDARNSHDPDCHWCTGLDYCGDGIELLHGIRQFQWDFSFVMGEGFHSECSETPGYGIATYTYGDPGPYTVKLFVTDNDKPCCCDNYPNCWDWSKSLEKSVVAVEVENVTFDPTALCADGSSTSTASATITPDTRTITWSIQGDALGCTINSSTGVITAGTTGGTITVRATDSVLSGCYAEADIDVVKVENVTFDPEDLYADGISTSTASATITPVERTIVWSIQGDALGCSINSSTGVITAGTTAGTITVRAADSELPNCYAEADIDVVKAVLKSIEFTSDHEDGGDNILKESPSDKYANVGSAYSQPEWTSTGTNNPITHTKDTYITVKVTVDVDPSGVSLKLKGDGPDNYVDFESSSFTSTGSDQVITITADAKLQNKICHLTKTINWKAVLTNEYSVSSSGGHEICVTWGTPSESATRCPTNSLTYKRIKLLCKDYGSSGICGQNTSVDACAEDCQDWIRVHSGIDTSGRTPTTCDEVWGLLDGVGKGQCGESGILMNNMTELLGISSTYEHIKAAAWLPVPIATTSPCALQHRPNTSPPYPACTTHPTEVEELWMVFPSGPFAGWNEGEGGCRVGTKFYPAFSTIVGEDEGTRTAEHHTLIQFGTLCGADFQKWLRPSKVPCGESAPVPPVP